MKLQSDFYADMLAKLSYEDRRFVRRIDGENLRYINHPSSVTRSGFVEDLARRDQIVSNIK